MEISQASSSMTSMAEPISDKQVFGAQVVSKTLDYMNSGGIGSGSSQSGMSQTYDLSKNVLGAYAGLGVTTDLNV